MWNVKKIVKKGDYLYALVPDHPRCTRNGYVLEHRIVMENLLGRILNSDEIVHHINGNKHDNRPENLTVMSALEHATMHSLEKGKMTVRLTCPNCGVVFERPKNRTHLVKGSRATFCSRKCAGAFNMMAVHVGLTADMYDAISANIVLEYRKYSSDNAEETATTGSVETIRVAPETAKT